MRHGVYSENRRAASHTDSSDDSELFRYNNALVRRSATDEGIEPDPTKGAPPSITKTVRSECINVGFLGSRKGVVTLTHWPIGHQGCRCRIPFPNAARTPCPDSPSRPTRVARPLIVDERMLNPHGVCAEPSCGCPRRLAGLGECTGVVGLRRTHRIATCNKLTDRGVQSAGRYVDRPGSTGHGQFTRRTNRGRRRCAECRIPLRTPRS